MTHSQRREIARTLMPLALLVLLMQAVAPWQSLSRVAMGGAGIGDGICLAGGAEASPTDDGRAPLRHDHAAACCLPSQRQADAGAPLILWTPAPPAATALVTDAWDSVGASFERFCLTAGVATVGGCPDLF